MFHKTVLTDRYEVVVSCWNDTIQLTIQSKKRDYDDYHLSQAGTSMTRDEARELRDTIDSALISENVILTT